MYVRLSGSDLALPVCSRMDVVMMLGLWASMVIARHKHEGFCLGTSVLRHSAVGIGLFVHALQTATVKLHQKQE